MDHPKSNLKAIAGVTEIDDNDAEIIAGGKFKAFLGTGKANSKNFGQYGGLVNIEDANRLLINNTGRDGENGTNNEFQIFFNSDYGLVGRESVTSGNASKKFKKLKRRGATFVAIRQGDDRVDLNFLK